MKNIIIVSFVLVSVIFSQSPKSDYVAFAKPSIQLADSSTNEIEVKGLINYNRIDNVFTTSLQWGSVAIVVGAILETAFSPYSDFKYLMTALGGMAAATVEFGYGAFSNIPADYNVGKKKFGFQINMGQTMASGAYRFIGNFGLTYSGSSARISVKNVVSSIKTRC